MMKKVLIALLIVTFGVSQFQRPAFTEENGMPEAQLIYILKNDDALLETRKTVVDELLKDLNDNHRTAILEALQIDKSTDTAKLFRVYLEEKIAAVRDEKILKSLRNTLEGSGPIHFRQSALSILWKSDPDSISLTMFRIIQNSSESEELRLASIERMANMAELLEGVLKSAKAILANKSESINMRRACIDFIEMRIEKEEMYNLYRSLISDSSNNPQFRRFLVMKGVYLHIPNYAEDLIKIVSDKKNDILLRQTATQGLNLAGNAAIQFLPELRRVYSVESDPTFKENLRSFIEQVENR